MGSGGRPPGFGGPQPGSGRPAELKDRVRVVVYMEREERDAVRAAAGNVGPAMRAVTRWALGRAVRPPWVGRSRPERS